MRIKQYKVIIILIDVLIIILSIYYSFLMDNDYRRAHEGMRLEPSILLPSVIIIFAMVIIYRASGLYKMHVIFDYYHQLVVIVKALLISGGLLIALLFFNKHPLLEERRIIVPSFIFMLVLFPIYRIIALNYLLRFVLKNKIIGEKVILIGADSKGQEIVKELINNKYSYFTPIGFLDDQKLIGETYENIKVLDRIDNITKYINDFDEILITLTNVSYNNLQKIIDVCRRLKKPIHVISDLYRIVPEKLEVEKFSGFSTFQIPPIDGFDKYPYFIIKRIMDYSVALIIILLFSPIWFVLALLIKAGSKGPVLYKAEVVGFKEKKFTWYKLRTMYINTDDLVHKKLVKEIASGLRDGQKLQNDIRVTRIGKWLRKFSMDEFPQLINIIKGQMSLVGPRPVLHYEYELLDDWQKERFTVLPGMTGLWQVRGRNKVNFADQHVLDLYYVRNRSIALDLEILFSTISVVISGKTGV